MSEWLSFKRKITGEFTGVHRSFRNSGNYSRRNRRNYCLLWLTLRIINDAMQVLEKMNISCEIIDVQTLLPFDIDHKILESLKKTNRIVFIDEDVPDRKS